MTSDFKMQHIIDTDYEQNKMFDVEPITSGFGDFAASTELRHVVKAGETLGTISQLYYGTTANYQKIYEANRALMSAKGMNVLNVGWTLIIPPVAGVSTSSIKTTVQNVSTASPVTKLLGLSDMQKKMLIGLVGAGVLFMLHKKMKAKRA